MYQIVVKLNGKREKMIKWLNDIDLERLLGLVGIIAVVLIVLSIFTNLPIRASNYSVTTKEITINEYACVKQNGIFKGDDVVARCKDLEQCSNICLQLNK